jgi:ribosomal protein L13E
VYLYWEKTEEKVNLGIRGKEKKSGRPCSLGKKKKSGSHRKKSKSTVNKEKKKIWEDMSSPCSCLRTRKKLIDGQSEIRKKSGRTGTLGKEVKKIGRENPKKN